MEKEQKKLLLVAVSVGVFLLVTITVALVLITPKTQSETSYYYAGIPFQSAGNVQSAESDNNQPSVTNNTQETNANIYSGNPEPVVESGTDNDKQVTTIQLTVPKASGVPDTQTTPVATVTAASKPATEIVQNTPASVKSTASSVATTQPSSSAASVAAAPSRTINDYWIQTGSFRAKVRADDAQVLLESKGFTSIIENRDINGNTWYRVRLGPYTSQNEADFWLEIVKGIDGFGESQVWQTTRHL
jgi:DedD protein